MARFRRTTKGHGRRGGLRTAAAGIGAAAAAGYAMRKRKAGSLHQARVAKRARSTLRPRRYARRTGAPARRRNVNGGIATSEYSRLRAKYGRRISKKAQIMKTVTGNTYHVIDKFGALNRYLNTDQAPVNALTSEAGCGAYWLHSYYGASSQQYVPMHLFDLTGRANYVNGTFTNPTIASAVSFTASSTVTGITFNEMNGRDGNVAPVINYNTWSVHNGPGTVQAGPLDKGFLQSVHIKMLCYGAAQFPTKYEIDLVQFNEDWLLPGTTDTQFANERITTYEGMIKNFLAHPIAQESRVTNRKFKVIKSIKFVLQPKLSIETMGSGTGTTYNTIGHHKEIDLYMPINRLISYNWLKMGNGNAMQDPDTAFRQIGQYSQYASPRQRIFLIVRANNTVMTINPGVPTCVNTPSYDLSIKRHWRDLL